MSSSDLYETDALAWAEQQAALLRRLAAGERVNADVDWPNVIEEVQDVGLSELRACRSLLRQTLLRLLKLHAWPASPSAPHWRDEVRAFRSDLKDAFAPSMRQRIDVDGLYVDAPDRARAMESETGTPAALPDACPFTLDDLLAGNIPALIARIGKPG